MKLFFKFILFILLLVCPLYSLSLCIRESNFLNNVFFGSLKNRLALFLDNVLRQVSSDDFFKLVEKINDTYHPQSDKDWYEHLSHSMHTIRPFLGKYSSWYKFVALKHQRNILAEQIKSLISVDHASGIEVCLEIGKPCTYISSIKGYLPNIKHSIAVNDSKKWLILLKDFHCNLL